MYEKQRAALDGWDTINPWSRCERRGKREISQPPWAPSPSKEHLFGAKQGVRAVWRWYPDIRQTPHETEKRKEKGTLHQWRMAINNVNFGVTWVRVPLHLLAAEPTWDLSLGLLTTVAHQVYVHSHSWLCRSGPLGPWGWISYLLKHPVV